MLLDELSKMLKRAVTLENLDEVLECVQRIDVYNDRIEVAKLE